MRPDIVPGGTFPDYELPDHTNTPRKLSDLQGEDPLILTLARGHYCPKENQQHLELAAFYPKIAVAYTQIATISTDDHHTTQEFRASVGAQWPFLSDPERKVQKDLDIQEYTDPEHNAMIPHTLVLKPGLVIHQHLQRLLVLGTSVVRRPLARPASRDERDPPRLGPEHPWTPPKMGRGRRLALPRMEQAARSETGLGLREGGTMVAESKIAPARYEPDLAGQTVVVIGGTSGIGLETARRARAEGADVILTARDADRLRRVGAELGARTAASTRPTSNGSESSSTS